MPSTLLTNPAIVEARSVQKRFYRPELDALRFFAFFGVFLLHGPRFNTGGMLSVGFNWLANGLSYCLCLFFFLSSYLITELLLREREKTGGVSLRRFYTRRILRIWPLYYLGIGIAIALSHTFPQRFLMTHQQMIYYLLLVGFIDTTANPMGVLWSISVEEIFYLLWPGLAKLGLKAVWIGCFVIIPISMYGAKVGYNTWYNPVVQFLFFALGGMTALTFHRRTWALKLPWRIILLASGIAFWISVSWDGHHSLHGYRESLVYVVGAIGTVLVFLSVLGLPERSVPPWLIYLGRISFGLYVFHLVCMRVVQIWIGPALFASLPEYLQLVLEQAIALAFVILLASVVYRYYELPFLRLKERFE